MIGAIYPIGLPIALSLAGYNSILTGFFVMFKRRDRIAVRYFAFSFFVFGWGLGISFMLNNDLMPSTSQYWGRFSQMAALFIPVTWLHFVLSYVNKTKQFRWLLQVIYFTTFAIFPFTMTPAFIPGFRPMVQVESYPIPGPLYVVFTGLFVFAVFLAFWILCRAWLAEKASPERKKDYKLLFFAQLYGFVTGSLCFLPVYGVRLPQYNLLIMPMWQFLLAYAMVRHSLFDLNELAQAAQKDKLAAIGTLATSINHEIRNPLYVIQGLADSHLENLKDGIYASEQDVVEKSKEILQKTSEQAKRAMEIMKGFASFAKQQIHEEAAKGSVNLNDVLEQISPLIRHELELDKIELVKEIPQELFPIQADKHHIEEIFFNLIVNACQAMKETGGKIEIGAAQHNGAVQIEIKDNGPGIAPNRLAQIFEPFYTTKEEGTGLGLYITKQLVERNGGKISVRSKPGQGTSFTLEFKR